MRLANLGEFRVLTLRETAPTLFTSVCDSPDVASQYWHEHVATCPWFNPDVENMVGLVLSARKRPQGHYLVSQGTQDTLLCHPREVFRAAIVGGANSIIVFHNHPSGDPTPSEADIKVTRDLIKAGQLLKIDVCDHVIIGSGSVVQKPWCSLRELGYFYA